MEIDDVPGWHNPFKCDAATSWPDRPTGRDWTNLDAVAFTAWQRSVPFEVGRCGYHHEPFVEAMRLTIDVVKRLVGSETWNRHATNHELGDTPRTAIDQFLPAADGSIRWYVETFLYDPITWLGNDDYLTNGQH